MAPRNAATIPMSADPANETVISTRGFQAKARKPHAADLAGSGLSRPKATIIAMTAMSSARMTSFSVAKASVRWLPTTLATENESRIQAGPYTLGWVFHRIQGNQGSAQNLFGLTTNGFAPWMAWILP